MKHGVLASFLVCLSTTPLSAQSVSAELYKAKVITLNGKAVRGILYDVSEIQVHLVGEERFGYGDDARMPLVSIRRVVIRRSSRRGATTTGAIIGGVAMSFFVVQSARKYGFRSPVSYGLNLTLGAAAGAAAGALVGNKIGNTSRRVIRPIGRDPETAGESLRRQLEPFTSEYQNGFLNRLPP